MPPKDCKTCTYEANCDEDSRDLFGCAIQDRQQYLGFKDAETVCIDCIHQGYCPGKASIAPGEACAGRAVKMASAIIDDKGECRMLSGTQRLIYDECSAIGEMLIDKNRKYGDSVVSPKRIFSKAPPLEQINVRIDDKLSRIQSAQGDDEEDAELDLIGYLVLKRVAKRVQSNGRS